MFFIPQVLLIFFHTFAPSNLCHNIKHTFVNFFNIFISCLFSSSRILFRYILSNYFLTHYQSYYIFSTILVEITFISYNIFLLLCLLFVLCHFDQLYKKEIH